MEFLAVLMAFVIGAVIARSVYIGVTSAPFAAAPKRAIREALKLAELKPGETLYDLGSGDGRSLIIAAKEFGARAVGFELSWQWYLISRVKIFLAGAASAKVHMRDLRRADLREADVIFLWLTPPLLASIEKKLREELKPGARLVVFSSPLPSWKPTQVRVLSGNARLFLYFKEKG